MKVLFVSYWFPYPPNNGSRIRVYNFLKHLSKKHDVYLLSMLQKDSDPANTVHLEEFCKIVSLHPSRTFNPSSIKSLIGYFSPRPRSIVDIYDAEVDEAVQNAINSIKPDIVVASTLFVVEYVTKNLASPSILIDHNCEFAVLQRNAEFERSPIKRLQAELGWRKNARWEVDMCKKFSLVVLPSDDDKKHMLLYDNRLTNLTVIPNGSDVAVYNPDRWQPDSKKLIYTGALTYSANLDAIEYYVEEIYPILEQVRPGVKLYVTGRNDNRLVGKVRECPGVVLTGYVEDIREELYSSAMLVVPLRRGGGMRLKIPEAMAAGVPVVTTTMGCEGLEAIDREHLLIADTPEEFARAIIELLDNQDLAKRLSMKGRQLIEQKYDWRILSNQFVGLVDSLIIYN